MQGQISVGDLGQNYSGGNTAADNRRINVYEHLPKRRRGRNERAALHQGKAVRQFLHRHGER